MGVAERARGSPFADSDAYDASGTDGLRPAAGSGECCCERGEGSCWMAGEACAEGVWWKRRIETTEGSRSAGEAKVRLL